MKKTVYLITFVEIKPRHDLYKIPLEQNLYEVEETSIMKQSLGYYTSIILDFGCALTKVIKCILNRYTVFAGTGMVVGTSLPGVIGAIILFWVFNETCYKFIKDYLKTFILLFCLGLFVLSITPYKMGYTKPDQLRHQILESGENITMVWLQYGGNCISYLTSNENNPKVFGLFMDFFTQSMGDYAVMTSDGVSTLLDIIVTFVTNQFGK